jgi:nitroreductase
MEVKLMELLEAIATRRSIRKYQEKPVPRELIQKLLDTAILAPSGSNGQPWAFAIIQDKELLKSYSDRAKEMFIHLFDNRPDPQNYRQILANPDFNIFYNAGTLVVIYWHQTPTATEDCSMAAQNFMLAAHDAGLGTCWIGFSFMLLNDASFLAELGIPEGYTAVAPLILGYPETVPQDYKRNPPKIFVWK